MPGFNWLLLGRPLASIDCNEAPFIFKQTNQPTD